MVGFPSKFMNHYITINPFSIVITLKHSVFYDLYRILEKVLSL
jgi:hypothetical protein